MGESFEVNLIFGSSFCPFALTLPEMNLMANRFAEHNYIDFIRLPRPYEVANIINNIARNQDNLKSKSWLNCVTLRTDSYAYLRFRISKN